jgi:hypothetical protein
MFIPEKPHGPNEMCDHANPSKSGCVWAAQALPLPRLNGEFVNLFFLCWYFLFSFVAD